MQSKTTRAFRTISEAGEELDLQPHVLRFWESKFSDIKPIKRGGGRRFYRPEDIEFLRGIKILLHDEGHPIKDVQKLIRLKGPNRIMELGQSVQKASRDKKVEDTVLVPKRIQKTAVAQAENTERVVEKPVASPSEASAKSSEGQGGDAETAIERPPPIIEDELVAKPVETPPQTIKAEGVDQSSDELRQQRHELEEALHRLQALKSRWSQFTRKNTSSV